MSYKNFRLLVLSGGLCYSLAENKPSSYKYCTKRLIDMNREILVFREKNIKKKLISIKQKNRIPVLIIGSHHTKLENELFGEPLKLPAECSLRLEEYKKQYPETLFKFE